LRCRRRPLLLIISRLDLKYPNNSPTKTYEKNRDSSETLPSLRRIPRVDPEIVDHGCLRRGMSLSSSPAVKSGGGGGGGSDSITTRPSRDRRRSERPTSTTTTTTTSSPQKIDVLISVYDLLPRNNLSNFLWTIGAGLLHSGVVVGDREYAFGGHDQLGVTGVYWTRPHLEPPGSTFRTAVWRGCTYRTEKETEVIVKEVR
jgi:hypothetical protein